MDARAYLRYFSAGGCSHSSRRIPMKVRFLVFVTGGLLLVASPARKAVATLVADE
jgi:hypothetical protein